MRHVRILSPTVRQPHRKLRRGGTSLTEVLAALLVMSVGILSVMALFPIAILRSAQATQLTNATILAKRAEAIVEMFGLTSDTYIPKPTEGRVTHAIIDPLGWHDFQVDFGGSLLPSVYGNTGGTAVSGYLPPGIRSNPPPGNEEAIRAKWPTFKRPFAPGLSADVRSLNEPTGALPGVPLRRLSFGPLPTGATYANSTGGGPGPLGPYPSPAPVFTGGAVGSNDLRDSILAAVGLPDSFNNAFDGIPDAQTQSGAIQNVRFNITSTDLSFIETHPMGYPGSVNAAAVFKLVPGSRVVLFDSSGKKSQVRNAATAAGGLGLVVYPTATEWVIEWPTGDPLPYAPGTISEIRIQIPQSRYTWMMTIRKRGISGGSVSEVDCVTFFNRPLGDPEEERLHPVVSFSGNNEPTDTIVITFSSAPALAEPPPIRKGGWIFDPQNALWYRIVDVLAESPTAATVQLDRRSEKGIGWVTIPEGVINVFPLRTRVDQKRLGQARRS